MDDDETLGPTRPDLISGRTSDRVAEMSDEARAELARRLAGRAAEFPGGPSRKGVIYPDRQPSPPAEAPDAADATAARLAAELHATERRLDRIENSMTHARYQHGPGTPDGRYIRLASRARRLERQLRRIR
jgi:hypothetical protein